ncbi:MAG: hypothetical protein JXB47_10795 [Anaerolineae bacterium]|nr:hypothetical protein [Anaerolineae bacterium]
MADAREITFSLQDSQGKKSTASVNVPSATTEADTITFAQALAPLVDAITGSKITKMSLSTPITLPGGLKAAPVANSNNNAGALFQFITSGNHYTRTRVPGFPSDKFVTGSQDVDLEDTDVVAFTGAMISGSGGVSPCDARDEDITAITFARELFQTTRY